MAFETEEPAAAGSDPASEARAFLEAAGVRGITITGEGESWRVSVGWNEPERFVCAFSEKNPNTPTDPLFLAQEALAALIRNEGPCPHASHETPAPETDELWAPTEFTQNQWDQLDPGYDHETPEPQFLHEIEDEDFGAEMLAAESDAEQIPDALERQLDGAEVVVQPGEEATETLETEPALHSSPDHAAYPGVAILSDDISIALAQVIEAVAAEEEARVLAVEALQSDDLQNFRDYSNWPQGVEMPAHVQIGAARFQGLSQRRTAIQDHSLALRRSARDHRARGDLSALQAMRDGLGVGWP